MSCLPAVKAIGLAVTLCAAGAVIHAQEPQGPVYMTYPPLPASLTELLKGRDFVVRGTIVKWAGEPYEMESGAGIVRIPSTVYRVHVLEVFDNGDSSAALVGEQIMVRHLGFRSGDVRGGVDDSVPPLVVGREYLLVVFKHASTGTFRLEYGGNGVFERDKGLVRLGGQSALASRYRGTSWAAFLKALREAAMASRRAAAPAE